MPITNKKFYRNYVKLFKFSVIIANIEIEFLE